MAETHQRIFLLNRLMCKSVSRAPQEHKIPVPSGRELLQTIKALHDREVCVEFFDHAAEPDDFNHQARISENKGKNFIRVTAIDFQSDGAGASYCTLLLHFVDNTVRSFPVVDIAKFSGRELAGEDDERGAFAGHMMVRLPAADEYDDGTYRCVVEAVTNITRQSVEYLLSRQLRRQAREEDLRHPVTVVGKDGKQKTTNYVYHPKLELAADVGRAFSKLKGGTISRLKFTKRSEKQSIAQKTDVIHEDVFGDVEINISAKQGPDDPSMLKQWASALRTAYEQRGYKTKLYYRNAGGGTEFSGSANLAVDGATDLLMCQREVVDVPGERKSWVGSIQPEIRATMRSLLDDDTLWERAK